MHNQCVTFTLPSGASGMAAAMVRGKTLSKIRKFSETHKVKYVTKTIGYTLKIWFENESDYTLFFLVYDPDKQWRKPVLIDEEYKE